MEITRTERRSMHRHQYKSNLHSIICRFAIIILLLFYNAESHISQVYAFLGSSDSPTTTTRMRQPASIQFAQTFYDSRLPKHDTSILFSRNGDGFDHSKRKLQVENSSVGGSERRKPAEIDDDEKMSLISNATRMNLSRSSFIKVSASVVTLSTIMGARSSYAYNSQPSSQTSTTTTSLRSKNYYAPPIILAKNDGTPTKTKTMSETETLLETISGFVSGATLVATKTLFKYPLDTATVRLQLPNTSYGLTNLFELFEGSYRGISSVLVSNIPAGAVFFAIKDFTKSYLRQPSFGGDTMPKWLITCIAVGVAQPPYWLVRNPSEVVKTRQQAGVEGYIRSIDDNGEDSGEVNAIDAFRRVLFNSKNGDFGDGVKDLYSGYWENILYAYPADVIKFLCYEKLSEGGAPPAPLQAAVYGATSTAFAQFLTTPLDVVRNRIMANATTKRVVVGDDIGGNDNSAPLVGKESMVDSLQRVAREEGLSGLFAGVSPRIGKAFISGAIQFATYEETKKSIRKSFQKMV